MNPPRSDRDSLPSHAMAMLVLTGLAAGDAYTTSGHRRRVSEITQLALATAGGLIRGYVRFRNGKQPSLSDQMRRAYLRWAAGQGLLLDPALSQQFGVTGWLDSQAVMVAKRPRGKTARKALQVARAEPVEAANTSKGAAAVPRGAPCGLLDASLVGAGAPAIAFELGATSARLTHGHPVAHAATGAFAYILRATGNGSDLHGAVQRTIDHLHSQPVGCDADAVNSVAQHLQMAMDRSAGGGAYKSAADFSGWTGRSAEQALAIGTWAAVSREQLGEALALARTHGGERHSTGAICGALWGARAATRFLDRQTEPIDSAPVEQPLDLLDQQHAPEPGELTVVETVATDFARICRKRSRISEVDRMRWPGL